MAPTAELSLKLSSAVVAILAGVLKCQTQFWKGTTQGSFQQNLVEIGPVVSEEKIFFKFHLPFFYFWLTYSIFQHAYGKHNLVSFYGRIVF
jgi:hypothetical protein